MKKIKLVLSLLLMALVFNSCDKNNNINQEEPNQKVLEELVKPDFRGMLLGDKTHKYEPPIFPTLRTESDLIEILSPGCFLINARVYMSAQGGNEYLVANDNVQVGDCGENKMGIANKGDSDCNGYLPDGSLVIENNTDDDICLYELLLGNDQSYNQYLVAITQY